MAKKAKSGEGNKRALYLGERELEAPGYDIIPLEKGASPWETGFPKKHFDLVSADRVLQKQPRQKVLNCLNEWTRILKPGGTLHIVVPNMRWAAICLMREDFPTVWPAVLATFYGTQENEEEYHRVGFTLQMLRQLLEELGYKIKVATIKPWAIIHENEELEAEEIYIVGEKG